MSVSQNVIDIVVVVCAVGGLGFMAGVLYLIYKRILSLEQIPDTQQLGVVIADMLKISIRNPVIALTVIGFLVLIAPLVLVLISDKDPPLELKLRVAQPPHPRQVTVIAARSWDLPKPDSEGEITHTLHGRSAPMRLILTAPPHYDERAITIPETAIRAGHYKPELSIRLEKLNSPHANSSTP